MYVFSLRCRSCRAFGRNPLLGWTDRVEAGVIVFAVLVALAATAVCAVAGARGGEVQVVRTDWVSTSRAVKAVDPSDIWVTDGSASHTNWPALSRWAESLRLGTEPGLLARGSHAGRKRHDTSRALPPRTRARSRRPSNLPSRRLRKSRRTEQGSTNGSRWPIPSRPLQSQRRKCRSQPTWHDAREA